MINYIMDNIIRNYQIEHKISRKKVCGKIWILLDKQVSKQTRVNIFDYIWNRVENRVYTEVGLQVHDQLEESI
jgi:hypothetical protein